MSTTPTTAYPAPVHLPSPYTLPADFVPWTNRWVDTPPNDRNWRYMERSYLLTDGVHYVVSYGGGESPIRYSLRDLATGDFIRGGPREGWWTVDAAIVASIEYQAGRPMPYPGDAQRAGAEVESAAGNFAPRPWSPEGRPSAFYTRG